MTDTQIKVAEESAKLKREVNEYLALIWKRKNEIFLQFQPTIDALIINVPIEIFSKLESVCCRYDDPKYLHAYSENDRNGNRYVFGVKIEVDYKDPDNFTIAHVPTNTKFKIYGEMQPIFPQPTP